MVEKISTGITGLDEMTNGGFVFPSVVYLLGEPGTGKTTFGMQFLVEGAKKNENGMYITTIGDPEKIVLQPMKRFSFFEEKYFYDGTIVYEDLSVFLEAKQSTKNNGSVYAIVDELKNMVQEHSPKRIVIDSITPLSLRSRNISEYRSALYELFASMRRWNSVVIVIGEARGKEIRPEQYLADAVIHLGYYTRGIETLKFIRVLKMREVAHDTHIHTLTISRAGISLSPFPAIGFGGMMQGWE
ncbi:MAG: ATPase domain-containing protein [Thermoplasmata archaeon]